MYVVLISRHRYEDKFTTQIKFFTPAMDVPAARIEARLLYLPYYRPEHDGLVAYFTGQITYV